MKVIMIAAMTICGRISPAVMGSEIDRQFLEKMRDKTDASLMGAQTLREGDPVMHCSGGQLPPNRMRAIMSGSGDLPVQGKRLFAAGPKPLLFTGKAKANELRARVNSRAEVHGLPGNSELSVKKALEMLSSKGVKSVLIEGGGKLNYAALKENVVDELLVTVTPYIMGYSKGSSLVEGPEPLGEPFMKLELISSEETEGGEIFLRYKILK